MSAKVVTPPRICSAAASRAPQRTNSSVTFFASAGKMYLRSHSSSVTSSRRPRSSVIGTCVWPLMNPGRISLPRASIFCLTTIPFGAKWRAALGPDPMATISSPRTARKPSSRMRRLLSIVTIVPPVISRSTDTASLDGICARAEGIRPSPIAQKSRCAEIDFYFALEVRHDHGNVPAEFPDELAAGAARRCFCDCFRDHRDGVEAALAFADGFEDGDAFGANGEAVSGVFNVAPAEDSAGRGAQRSAHAKIRVRRMRVFPCLPCGRNQAFILAHANASGTLQNILRNRLSNARNDCFQQADELPFDALGGLQHFQMVERLIQDSRCRIRHAGDAQHANAAMPRGNHFGNRGHANEISADHAQVADLRRRFVTRPKDSCVHTLIHPDSDAVCFADGHFAEALVVGRGHVMEAQTEALIVWPRERIDALQIDVIADDHKPALHELAFDAACGVGEDHGLYAHAREDTNGKRNIFGGITFI